jgi:hypothetical protein
MFRRIVFAMAAGLRLQTISFVLMGLLASAAVVWLVWNWLRRDFSRLPRLSYAKACGVVVLWGLLFIVVLTMISGARELMTPGAWEKNGLTYKLRSEKPAPPPADDSRQLARRRTKLAELGEQLKKFAEQHDHQYPNAEQASQIPDSYWRLDDLAALRYVYVPGRSPTDGATPLAYEPQVVGGRLLMICADGQIERLDFDDIIRRIPREKSP